MIIVDFYINDFIFALFLFIKDGKVVNYNGSEIIGLINFKYGKRMAFRDNYFTVNAGFFREAGKRSTTGHASLSPQAFLSVREKQPLVHYVSCHCCGYGYRYY